MSDLLMRDAAPFDEEVWSQIDAVVEATAWNIWWAGGSSTSLAPWVLARWQSRKTGLPPKARFAVAERDLIALETLRRDFILAYEDITLARQMNLPLDLSPVAQASVQLARQEDELIFATLRKAKGAASVSPVEWDQPGGAFATVLPPAGKTDWRWRACRCPGDRDSYVFPDAACDEGHRPGRDQACSGLAG